MKKLFLYTFFGLFYFTFNNANENLERKWLVIYEDEEATYLIDKSSIKMNTPGTIKYIELTSWNEPQDYTDGRKFLSRQLYKKAMCSTKENVWYLVQYYDVRMKNGVTMEGNTVDTLKASDKVLWKVAPANTINGVILSFACEEFEKISKLKKSKLSDEQIKDINKNIKKFKLEK